MTLVDEMTERALTTLRGHCGDSPVSLFIDPTVLDSMDRLRQTEGDAAWICEWSRARIVKLPPIHEDFDPDRHPYLLHVASEPEAERLVNAALRVAMRESLGESETDGSARTVCSFIANDSAPEESARRFASLARIVRPDGKRWYWRFWDPRVLWHLPRVLPKEQWKQVGKALGQWLTLDPKSCLRAAYPHQADVESDSTACLRALTQPTWQRLSLIGPTNRVLALAAGWNFEPTPAFAQRIEDSIVRAQAWGCAADGDAIVFAAVALTSHDDFDQHPDVAQALRGIAEQGHSLAAALAPFDDQFWIRLKNEQRSGATTHHGRAAET